MKHFDEVFNQPRTRRSVLKFGAAAAIASQVSLLEQAAWLPQRAAMAASGPPDIQFDIGAVIPPAFTVEGVQVRFGPVFTLFAPARLTRNPTLNDQRALAGALQTIESVYPFSPSGVIMILAYGLPYFRRLAGATVAAHMPLTSDTGQPVLIEAVPSPTDVVKGNGITKDTFNVPVAIEANDLCLMIRSDSIRNVTEVLAWLQGSNFLNDRLLRSPDLAGLIRFQTPRLLFQQIGLPRKVANAANLPYARQINPQSPMWMGFGDQQVDASASAQTVSFLGSATAKLTNAKAGDYLDNGSIMHFSHDILDLAQFYALPNPNSDEPAGETYQERIQYMFRSNQLGTQFGIPNMGNTDQFTDGGGPAFIANTFQGTDDAMRAARDSAGKFTPQNATRDATFTGAPRIGHNQALQRHSRAADGTPLHARMDGTGFDRLDVPDGSIQPKLEFAVFMPTAQLFQTMREGVAAQDLQNQFNVPADDNGLERFITATRRQNFLVPPRRHRAFPLLELGGTSGGGGWRWPFGR